MRALRSFAVVVSGLVLTGCLSVCAPRPVPVWDAESLAEQQGLACYLAVPETEPGERVPGIILVHEQGGMAARRWALYWKGRGYAALALTRGGSVGELSQIHLPPQEQDPYLAVADVLRARVLLSRRPEVDPARIGVCGLGWGGMIACLAAGADGDLAYAASLRGCGFLEDGSVWEKRHRAEVEEPDWRAWCALWDPRHYLGRVRCPFLWLGDEHDAAYPLPCVQASMALAGGRAVRVLRPSLVSSRGPERSADLAAFVDGAVGRQPCYPRATAVSARDGQARARFRMEGRTADFASFRRTEDVGAWEDRVWKDYPADFDGACAEAPLPKGATAWYFSVFFDDGRVVSSDLRTDD